MLRRSLTFIAILASLMGLTPGCTGQDDEPDRPRLQEPLGDAEPPSAVIEVLHDLADIMDDREKSPDEVLKAVRSYIQENREAVSAAVKDIERTTLNLSEAQRTEYVSAHADQARKAMQHFAHAQQRFRERASEAQQVELTEILNTL